MSSHMPYTYLIKHKATGKFYQGCRTRRGCNPTELLKEGGYITSSKVVQDIIKDEGLSSFEIINIEIYENIEEAKLAEELYHKEYDVESNVYYLNRHNAGSKFSINGPLSEKHRENVIKAIIGRKHTEETKLKMSMSRKGIVFTEEHKSNLSKSHKNQKPSEETRKKMSETRKGRKHSQESIKKMRKSKENVSEESKLKMRKPKPKVKCPHCLLEGGIPQMKRWHFDNCKSKLKEVA